MVSHNPLFDLENLCENSKSNANLSGLKHIDFDKLGKEEKNQVKEALYAMMSKFKNTPLEFSNSITKGLYDIVEQKWHHCLNLEKQIRESTLAQVMPELTKGQIVKEVKRYAVRFTPKYRAFNILQNNIEDVVNKSTQIWELIYGLTIVKKGEIDPSEAKDDDKDDDKDNIVGGEIEMKEDDKAIAELEQQEDQSVHDTQLSSVSPPYDTSVTTETIIVKDVSDPLA